MWDYDQGEEYFAVVDKVVGTRSAVGPPQYVGSLVEKDVYVDVVGIRSAVELVAVADEVVQSRHWRKA